MGIIIVISIPKEYETSIYTAPESIIGKIGTNGGFSVLPDMSSCSSPVSGFLNPTDMIRMNTERIGESGDSDNRETADEDIRCDGAFAG